MARIYKALLAAAASAAAIAAFGVTAASAASPPAARTGKSGTEHLQLMTTSATASKSSIIATGVFTAAGVDKSGNKIDTITFPGGTFKINHSGVTHGKQNFNPKTCLLTVKETGPYTIGHGTGRYAGIRGHGKATVTILAIAARNSHGKCSMTLPPAAFHQVINASGPIHL